MRLAKDEKRTVGPTASFQIELEKNIIEQIQAMEQYTKISKEELVTTALKRFISQHKDYFPPQYKF